MNRKLDRIQDGVNQNTVMLREHTELLKKIDATTINNIKRIANLLNTELTVPNLILVVPAPEK